MEGYIIAFCVGFLIDKMSLFPFVVGFGLGTVVNNPNYSQYYTITKNYIKHFSEKKNNLEEKK